MTLVNVREWKRVKGRVDILRGEERRGEGRGGEERETRYYRWGGERRGEG